MLAAYIFKRTCVPAFRRLSGGISNVTNPPHNNRFAKRDRAGSGTIGSPDDGTPIREMFQVEGNLLLITEKCTYKMQVADQIDPNRTNPDIPHNVHQKIFDHGVNSRFLCNTLLLAKVMFRKECQPALDIERAKALALEALSELILMDEVAKEFSTAEKLAIEGMREPGQGGSIALPALGNVRTRAKTFFQKADHFAIALMSILRLFYIQNRSMNWDEFQFIVTEQFGASDDYSKVATDAVLFLKLVRNTRDCLEHRLQGVVTSDFALEPNGELAAPTIVIDYRGSKQNRCSLSLLMEESRNALLALFEMLIVHTCAKHVQNFAGLPIQVGLLSDEYQKAWRVRFAYGIVYEDGQFAPFG